MAGLKLEKVRKVVWLIEVIKSDFSAYRTPIYCRVDRAANGIRTTVDPSNATSFPSEKAAEEFIPAVRAMASKLNWRVSEVTLGSGPQPQEPV